MAGDPIKTVVLKGGAKRYRFVVDIGRDPKTGKRQQKTMTFDKKGEATKEWNRIRHQTDTGTYVKPSAATVNQIIDSYLKGATRGKRANTARNYQDSFRCVRELHGTRKAQTISKDDIEDLIDYMLTRGRKRGGKPGTGLSGRSVNLTLGRLKAAFELAVREGKLVRNVVALVDTVSYQQAERRTWEKEEVHTFLRAIADDRLALAWRLSLYGLRRGEVLGLRWSDIDLRAQTLTVAQTRVLVDYEVRVEKPKTKNGERTLPLDAELVAGLKALRKQQQAEAEAAGEAYDVSGYVVTDELGAPVHPEWYSDEFGRILRSAKLPRITLHDGRHTTLSLMEKAGVPISVISKWAGHYDSAFTQSRYVHANKNDLAEGAEKLAAIYKIA